MVFCCEVNDGIAYFVLRGLGKMEKNVKAECITWGIMGVVLIGISVIHPRAMYFVEIFICIAGVLLCRKKNKKKTPGRTIRDILGYVFVIVLLYFYSPRAMINLLFTHHSVFEYQQEMIELKDRSSDRFGFFPDKIPAEAKRVKWDFLPSFMQGNGYRVLSFTAEEEYLQEMKDRYTGTMCIAHYDEKNHCMVYDRSIKDNIYTYDEEQQGWKNGSGESAPYFTGQIWIRDIASTERRNVEVFLLYVYDGSHGTDTGGFYIDHSNDRILFWEDN